MNDIVKLSNAIPGVLQITLNRPDQLNALSHDVLMRLSSIFTQAKQDESVKALLINGEGKGFCAGADIKQLDALDAAQGLTFARFGQQICRQLEMLNKPSIAAIHGFAFGGGCELAMSATMRLATNNAVFGQPEIKLGVIPGFGGTQRLSRLIGKGRALEICMTGRRFSADEAFRWGLVNELTTPEELLPKSLAILQELVKLPSLALESINTTIQLGYDLCLEEALELEATHFAITCATADKKEGVNAFLTKRTAVFSGK